MIRKKGKKGKTRTGHLDPEGEKGLKKTRTL